VAATCHRATATGSTRTTGARTNARESARDASRRSRCCSAPCWHCAPRAPRRSPTSRPGQGHHRSCLRGPGSAGRRSSKRHTCALG
jgi:hypothetical protein